MQADATKLIGRHSMQLIGKSPKTKVHYNVFISLDEARLNVI
jgi:hypothetical protein